MNRLWGGLVLGLLVGDAVAGEHVDARDHPAPGAGQAAFERMERALVRGFDGICGDTFCEGDYGNLRALQLRCAVAVENATVSGCLWSFAGSYAYVTGAVAQPEVEARVWVCELPLQPGTSLAWMLEALSGRDALETRFPGTGLTAYEGLVDCL